jgi:SAM-dependent methyltransferase
VTDLPFDLDAGLAERLGRVLDIEGKIPKALQALGPVAERDVILVDGGDGLRARQLRDLGARLALVAATGDAAFDAPDGSADVLVATWSAFRGAPEGEVAQAERLLRPGGRLLVVQDYGRDDVASARGLVDAPEYGAWSRRDGPFLSRGFKIRVIHCWLAFESLEEATTFLGEAFGAPGREAAARLTRARLSYNVAVYHRTFGEAVA